MTASESGADQKPHLNRQKRRARKRAVIRQILDGPPKKPVCGQAKAAARARSASTPGLKLAKGDPSLKARARELQASTGQPYGVCLAEVRSLEAARRSEERDE
ncbi:hypothetical protein [Streptomyces sp. NPDC102487]|uniref:hypothetical protein n=1 Tax=Streptomyces sp. NPDC102487 TaxID=3366182 RepID=UPI003811C3FF